MKEASEATVIAPQTKRNQFWFHVDPGCQLMPLPKKSSTADAEDQWPATPVAHATELEWQQSSNESTRPVQTHEDREAPLGPTPAAASVDWSASIKKEKLSPAEFIEKRGRMLVEDIEREVAGDK